MFNRRFPCLLYVQDFHKALFRITVATKKPFTESQVTSPFRRNYRVYNTSKQLAIEFKSTVRGGGKTIPRVRRRPKSNTSKSTVKKEDP
ncbi:jg16772 [Pararge aegeria aegeria]|uniref:Jg16772 protein n=1 Tax=Pararge aegeria aegeria TaxID=348720 RepID=A0A8S4R8G2_9NEOP|nr:jg16772 [Pararge aegeria aegeria]